MSRSSARPSEPAQRWSADDYAKNARFVAELGTPLLGLLAPREGERILDLGCGDGALTEKIAATGADVLGTDMSENLLAAAKARGLDVVWADGHDLPFENEFDAVFSNAALHWMNQPDKVIEGVFRALKPKGRFVAELGGHGNVAAIATALRAVAKAHDADPDLAAPWYFPSANEYAQRLEQGGFLVQEMKLFSRPTPLPGDIEGWLATFSAPFFEQLPEQTRADAVAETAALLKPALCDSDGLWVADYARLRFAAERAS
ncbi:methyltransferase domain-containing protein [Methyloligella sp. 2.7D]|uniref:class I SAM-dependent methyltransferase n=1 Tax=unclassified Methyloligella TaxID=2625955 RepID=UPI00157BB8DF|nr:class I SAM-dependent methyltransferase [Methyloligella sp. GL2]QKP77818.1 methyltransferase domain-containing protein [Methyloligella sp. GL2]